MSSKFRAPKAAISPDASGGPACRWEEVLGDMVEATYSKPTFEAELLMLAVLPFGCELRLLIDEASETPHGMTPEEMIKSLAVQTLAEWRGNHYRPTLRWMAATVTSVSLVSVIEAVIEKAAAAKGRRWQAEPVAELHPQDSSHAVEVDCGWDGRDVVTQYDQGDRVLREAFVVVAAFGMTALAPRPSQRERQTA